MGWSSANGIFDPVAQKLAELGASDELVTGVLETLIEQLQGGDWDTEDESLERFADDEAVVEAFRRRGVYDRCGNEGSMLGTRTWCRLETGHDGPHDNHRGQEWD